MFSIAANALYTALRKRGTTRHLAGAIVICVVSALLLLPAMFWYNFRFNAAQAALPAMEIVLALAYVAACGWLLPLGTTVAYCLFSQPRLSATAARIASISVQRPGGPISSPGISGLPGAKYAGGPSAPAPAAQQRVPRYPPGVLPPFVFGDESPWGWLEYRGGNFQGQRLALKRVLITIGRDEECDIWIDDDMASRYHAELIWEQGRSYLNDCESLNGVTLNGQRIRGAAVVQTNDHIEIGTYHFTFVMAEQKETTLEDSDPLAHHKWRSSLLDPVTAGSDLLPATRADLGPIAASPQEQAGADKGTATPMPANPGGALTIRSGLLAGQTFLLDRPIITVGSGAESDIVIDDTALSHRHLLFLHQANGDYVQDLGSQNGTMINAEQLTQARRMQAGDKIFAGNLCLEYSPIPQAQTTPITNILTPRPPAGPTFTGPISRVSPTPLRLPSRQK
jgi:pSer/pThr/pTyr-binding forkhead associated (FHA) protein